ncbi:hypothetical protein DYB26_010895, partial [Aphanomyces astaci]
AKAMLTAMMILLRRRRLKRRRMMLMSYLVYHYSAYLLKTSKRVSILSGALWVAEILQGNEDAFEETFRMSGDAYGGLLHDVVQLPKAHLCAVGLLRFSKSAVLTEH